MHRDRPAFGGVGTGASKLDVTPIDRKRINEALDKQLERSSPSTSRTVINGKDNKPSAPQSVLMTKPPSDQRDSHSASLSKTNCSGCSTFSLCFFFCLFFSIFLVCVTIRLVSFSSFFTRFLSSFVQVLIGIFVFLALCVSYAYL